MDEENENMSNAEAPLSTTIKAYYKGYSVLITMRDPRADPQPLIERAIYAIDWMDSQRDFKPTNWKKEAPSASTPSSPKKDSGQCSVNHDELPALTVKKEGKNKGRTFQACPRCNYFKWLT